MEAIEVAQYQLGEEFHLFRPDAKRRPDPVQNYLIIDRRFDLALSDGLVVPFVATTRRSTERLSAEEEGEMDHPIDIVTYGQWLHESWGSRVVETRLVPSAQFMVTKYIVASDVLRKLLRLKVSVSEGGIPLEGVLVNGDEDNNGGVKLELVGIEYRRVLSNLTAVFSER